MGQAEIQQLADQRLARAKVIVQRRAVALPRFDHDLAQRHQFDTMLGKQALGDLEHAPGSLAFQRIAGGLPDLG